MRVRSKLKPGQPGTRKLVQQFGERLVCVRYRYDALKRRRYTTAEIIVDESDWDPMPSATARRERVAVRIDVHEVKLREKVKAAGGMAYPAVGHAVRRIERRRQSDARLDRVLVRLESQLVDNAT